MKGRLDIYTLAEFHPEILLIFVNILSALVKIVTSFQYY